MPRFRFGFVDVSVDSLSAVEYGVLAEKSGFGFLWIPDHFVDVNGDKVEPWTVLAAVATRTKKIRLASAVTDTQRSHPARTAHCVASLDVISHCRAVLGIGAGEAMNIVPFGISWEPPADRVVRLEEAVQVIRKLWASSREKPVNYTGRFFTLQSAFLSQQPHQKPHPPIYIGAMSAERTLQVAGCFGDGWYGWFNTPATFKKRWSIIAQAAEAAGRSPSSIEPCSHIMVAFPRNRREHEAAMLGAKATLLMERTVLTSLGHEPHAETRHYMRLLVSQDEVAQVMNAAKEIPDEYVHKTMAIGGAPEVTEKVEELSKAGVRHFAIADLLAPTSVKRTLTICRKIIRKYN